DLVHGGRFELLLALGHHAMVEIFEGSITHLNSGLIAVRRAGAPGRRSCLYITKNALQRDGLGEPERRRPSGASAPPGGGCARSGLVGTEAAPRARWSAWRRIRSPSPTTAPATSTRFRFGTTRWKRRI